MVKISDALLLKRCFDLARLGFGRTKVNPIVGAVVEQQGEIVSEGYHKYFGGPHAEVNAIQNTDIQDFKDHTIYVSLEPCSHFGKTPPCTDLLISSNFQKCVISLLDCNPAVSGKGVDKLLRAGIRVIKNVLKSSGEDLIRHFIVQQRLKRPYIILKWAQSADGFLGLQGVRTKISNLYSDRLVHKWRADTDAILVGTNTVLIDDPKLDTRYYYGKNPVKICIDRYNRIPADAAIFKSPATTLLFSLDNLSNSSESTSGIIRLVLEKDSLAYVFAESYRQNIGSVLVEGGQKILQSCLDAGLWDECRIISSPNKLLEGLVAPTLSILPNSSIDLGGDRIDVYYQHR